ncbi:MAG: hypothetical protein A49_26680 [Methyloceanibacter sp.]|nr:MAG: hypothetical protein A49_26680 [Methyloceanibacter sp.]
MNGFAVESLDLTILEWGNSKPLQGKGGNPTETREEARKRAFGPGGRQRLTAVRFDGVLLVTDPSKLCEAVRLGIGAQKAFGFGLLSLAPVR